RDYERSEDAPPQAAERALRSSCRSSSFFFVAFGSSCSCTILFGRRAMSTCGSCGKRVLCVFQGAVGAFLAPTAPAVSTGVVIPSYRWLDELGPSSRVPFAFCALSASRRLAPRRGCP